MKQDSIYPGKINGFSGKFGKRSHTKVSLNLELDGVGLDSQDLWKA